MDNTFDADGKLTTSFSGYTNDQINAVAILHDGKFLAVGQANPGGNVCLALAKYNAPAGLEERVYVIQDANYNVTSITDTSGSVIAGV